jgi:cytochrome c553
LPCAGLVLAHPLSVPSALPGPTPPQAAGSTRGAGAQAAAGDAAAGRAAFLSSGCVGCHALASVGATGVVGPALTHIGQTRTLQWLVVQMHTPCASGHQRAGYACQMMVGAVAGLTEQQRRDLAAFLAAQK